MIWTPNDLAPTSPHKAALAVFIIVLAAGSAVAIFIFRSRAPSIPPLTKTASALVPSQTSFNAQDTDGDLLKDWEERIFKTDPNNPDTDGDGTPDGEEILQDRDPTKPGPDDKIIPRPYTPPLRLNNSQTSSVPIKDNLMYKLADYFGREHLLHLALNPSASPDPQAIAADMLNIINSEGAKQNKIYTAGDLRIHKDETPQSIEHYLISFDRILVDSFNTTLTTQNPLAILSDAVQTKDYSKLSTLDPILHAYDLLLKNLANLLVPKTFTDLHTRYLNAAVKEKEGVANIRNAESDMMSSILGVRNYAIAAQEFVQITKEFRAAYERFGIKPKNE